jgi:G:T-mismatch repair DNA endonuclease (very short patch repair protein)
MSKEYTCPNCGNIKTLADSSYKEAVRLKRFCNSCAMKKWHAERYGVKKDRVFTSTCPSCGKEKHHTKSNTTLYQLKSTIKKFNKRLCYSCSNSKHYTISQTKVNTKPEREFKKVARKNKIKYRQSYKYKGHYFDFYLPELDILVEVDGCYWHGKGLKDDELNLTQLKSRRNDKKKNKICLDSQKSLIRLWEDEVEIEVIQEKIHAVRTLPIKREVQTH